MRRNAEHPSHLLFIVGSLCLAPSVAFAHTGVGDTAGFVHGFMHPLSGLDHQLAMVLVGMFAYRLGGRALWLVPLVFVAAMALGGLLGVNAMPLPFVEVGIALSVIVLGESFARPVVTGHEADLQRAEPYSLEQWRARPVWQKVTDWFWALLRSQL